jgi:hypothetical protein
MRPEHADPASFVFRYTIKGLFWIATAELIVTLRIFIIGTTSWDFTEIRFHGFGDVLEMIREIVVMLPGSMIYIILITLLLIYPVMAVPFIGSTSILVERSYKDWQEGRLTSRIVQKRGIILGASAGVVTIFLRAKIFPVWPMVWTYILRENALQIIFWITIYTLPVTGAIVSSYLGKAMADTLKRDL